MGRASICRDRKVWFFGKNIIGVGKDGKARTKVDVTYEGEVSNDRKDGAGVLSILGKGLVLDGFWENDRMVGNFVIRDEKGEVGEGSKTWYALWGEFEKGDQEKLKCCEVDNAEETLASASGEKINKVYDLATGQIQKMDTVTSCSACRIF